LIISRKSKEKKNRTFIFLFDREANQGRMTSGLPARAQETQVAKETYKVPESAKETYKPCQENVFFEHILSC
jgi:hypothetical protein